MDFGSQSIAGTPVHAEQVIVNQVQPYSNYHLVAIASTLCVCTTRCQPAIAGLANVLIVSPIANQSLVQHPSTCNGYSGANRSSIPTDCTLP